MSYGGSLVNSGEIRHFDLLVRFASNGQVACPVRVNGLVRLTNLLVRFAPNGQVACPVRGRHLRITCELFVLRLLPILPKL